MTYPTDFRALCARVLKAEELILPGGGDFWKDHEEEAQAISRLMSDIRAALAAPQQGASITLEQLDDLCSEHGFHYDDDESLDVLRDVVSAALIRYGAQAVPVPVAERPWEREGWCDSKGRCWLCQGPRQGLEAPTWRLVRHGEGGWDFTRYPRAIFLPHWALPLPEAQP